MRERIPNFLHLTADAAVAVCENLVAGEKIFSMTEKSKRGIL